MPASSLSRRLRGPGPLAVLHACEGRARRWQRGRGRRRYDTLARIVATAARRWLRRLFLVGTTPCHCRSVPGLQRSGPVSPCFPVVSKFVASNELEVSVKLLKHNGIEQASSLEKQQTVNKLYVLLYKICHRGPILSCPLPIHRGSACPACTPPDAEHSASLSAQRHAYSRVRDPRGSGAGHAEAALYASSLLSAVSPYIRPSTRIVAYTLTTGADVVCAFRALGTQLFISPPQEAGFLFLLGLVVLVLCYMLLFGPNFIYYIYLLTE